MKRTIILAVSVVIALTGTATARSSGGISPNGGPSGLGACTTSAHGESCSSLAYRNESEADLSGLFRAIVTDDRGVGPMRGTLKLQQKMSGKWVTLDRRSEMSRSNARHTTQKLHITLPILQMTHEPHRLVAQINGEVVARLRI
jgi:hypothetical protein